MGSEGFEIMVALLKLLFREYGMDKGVTGLA